MATFQEFGKDSRVKITVDRMEQTEDGYHLLAPNGDPAGSLVHTSSDNWYFRAPVTNSQDIISIMVDADTILELMREEDVEVV